MVGLFSTRIGARQFLRSTALATGVLTSAAIGGAQQNVDAAQIVLPAPVAFSNAIPFGDFFSYSLNGLCEGDNGNANCNGSQYKFSAGSLKGELGIFLEGMGMGAGQTDNSEFGSGMDADNAWQSSGSLTSFSTLSTTDGQNDPPPSITGDMPTSWDVRLDPLRTYLGNGGGNLVFLFNHNETAGGDAGSLADPNDLLVAARVTLVDEAMMAPDKVFHLIDHGAFMANNLGLPVDGNGDPLSAADARWGLADGDFSIQENTGNLLSLDGSTCTDPADNGVDCVRVTSNIGGNIAFNAAYSQALQDMAITDTTYDLMKVEFVFRDQNSGPEQIWITDNICVTGNCDDPPDDSSEIHGFKYLDPIFNGVLDESLIGLENWVIELLDESGNVIDTVMTDETGAYWFTGLSAGEYTVREVLQNGWTQTGPDNPNFYTLMLNGNDVFNDINFWNETPPTIPEPAALALFGFGLAGLGFARRRKRSA